MSGEGRRRWVEEGPGGRRTLSGPWITSSPVVRVGVVEGPTKDTKCLPEIRSDLFPPTVLMCSVIRKRMPWKSSSTRCALLNRPHFYGHHFLWVLLSCKQDLRHKKMTTHTPPRGTPICFSVSGHLYTSLKPLLQSKPIECFMLIQIQELQIKFLRVSRVLVFILRWKITFMMYRNSWDTYTHLRTSTNVII